MKRYGYAEPPIAFSDDPDSRQGQPPRLLPPMYEKAGIDKYGLQKYRCLRGTSKVEGGPHANIYRKFSLVNSMSRSFQCIWT